MEAASQQKERSLEEIDPIATPELVKESTRVKETSSQAESLIVDEEQPAIIISSDSENRSARGEGVIEANVHVADEPDIGEDNVSSNVNHVNITECRPKLEREATQERPASKSKMRRRYGATGCETANVSRTVTPQIGSEDRPRNLPARSGMHKKKYTR